jgi:hypothetical protein
VWSFSLYKAVVLHGVRFNDRERLRCSRIIKQISETLDFPGTHQCINQGYDILLLAETWILGAVWEILVLFLAVWVVAKHLRDQQRSSIGWTIGGCFTVLIKYQVFYFAA